MYALVDGNNFYASCERVFRPDLRQKPIVVLSNNDGVIIARSNEAKLLGIPMGSPFFKVKELIDKHQIQVFSSNYALYGDMSQRMMSLLYQFSPEVEVYSIDEAFVKLAGFDFLDLHAYGVQMHKTILKSIGIPTSVGIAPSKALAKVANKITKKFPDRTQNTYLIDSEEKRIKALKWTKIEDVWGIGRRHSKRLNALGVLTAYDFTQMPDHWIRKHMSVVGLRLKQELLGESVLNIEKVKRKQSIATTRSFDRTYTEFDQVRERVATFAFSCAEKLRQQNTHCNSMMIFVHTNGFKTNQPQYFKNIIVQLPYPTHSSIELVKYATKGLALIFKKGYAYKKAGVVVMDFSPENPEQLSLFEAKNPAHKNLMEAIDSVNLRYGKHLVKLGSQNIAKTWTMKQENLSKRFSTSLDELIEIKV